MSGPMRHVALSIAGVMLFSVGTALAQPAPAAAPPPPPPPWTGSAGFGLALNRGNTATTNLNASFDATHDDKTGSVWKFKGLYLRGETDGAVDVDRLLLDARNERDLRPRVYGFGEMQFLKDQFKAIDYLWAASGGVGYKLIATPKTTFNADAGLGVEVQKNPGLLRQTDVVITASDKLEYKLSPVAALTESFGVLWKAQDFGDALYNFAGGAAAALTARTQLKVELIDTYATRPPTAAIKSNDVAVLTTVIYKF
jgi:putative salt-induced outer membrane protein YdiY